MIGLWQITALGVALCAQLGGTCDQRTFDHNWWATYGHPGMLMEYNCFDNQSCEDSVRRAATADEECLHAFDWCCSIDGYVSHHFYCRMKVVPSS